MQGFDWWRATYAVGIFFAVATLGIGILRRMEKGATLVVATWLYFIASGLSICAGFWRWTEFPEFLTRIQTTAAQATIAVALIPLAVFRIAREVGHFQDSWLRKALLFLGVLEAALIFTNGYGLFYGETLGAAYCAALIPFANAWTWPVFVAAVIKSKSSTGIMIMLAQFVGVAVYSNRFRRIALACIPVILFVGLLATGDQLLNSHGRIEFWGRFWQWWTNGDALLAKPSHWFGAGLGTWEWTGPLLQGFKQGLWVQLHNDWLQILFENGIVGFVLFAASFLYVVWTAFEYRMFRHFCALFGIAAFMLTYHPFRFMISELFVAYVAIDVLERTYD